MSQSDLKGCGYKPHKPDESKATHNDNSYSPVASYASIRSQSNVANSNNYDEDNGKKCERIKYVRDSSYWVQKTGKEKCPLNYQPESDYWSYPSSSECSYNHTGEQGFEELKCSESESE